MTTDIGELLVKLSADIKGLDSGLKQAKGQLSGFQNAASSFASTLRNTLALAGVAVGLYEIAGALKSFATESAMVGARTETLQIAMEQVGKTYGVSAASLNFFVEGLKGAGITTQESMVAVTKALTTGIPLEQLKDLATRARDIAVVADINTSEAMNRMMQGIITGEQETLRRLMIQVGSTDDIYKRFAATLGKTKEELNSVEKVQAMVNEVMRLSAGFAGIAAAADASVGKQLQSMARFAEEAKNALWALFGPIMQEGVLQLTGGWKSLQAWAEKNRLTLVSWGQAVSEFIQHKTKLIVEIGKFISQSHEMILTATKLFIFYQISGWIVSFTGALLGAIATIKVATPLVATLQAACAGPWAIVITVAIAGLAYGISQIRNLHKELDVERTKYKNRLKPKVTKPGDTFAVPKAGEVGIGPRGQISPELQKKLQIIAGEEKANEEAKKAKQKAKDDAPKPIGKAGGGKGGAVAKETTDNLLAPTQALYKAQRDAALQHHQNLFDLLKTGNEKEKAELERKLAAGLIDGKEYYQALQGLQQKETAAALAMIEEKKKAQAKAYQESLVELEADTKLSDAAKDIARRKLEVENKKSLDKLNTEAKQAILEGETKITNELKLQYENRKAISDTLAEGKEAAALGPILTKEAEINRLLRERMDLRDAKIKQGMAPGGAEAAQFDITTKELEFNKKYGDQITGMASAISTGLSSLVDAIGGGTQDLMKSANTMFKSIFNAALKPGLDQLTQLLVSGFKELFGTAGGAVGSAIMGVIGLVGMLLTSGGGNKSFTASGITSNVTGTEAVRGIIAGETSIPIAEISVSLSEVMSPHLGVLRQIEANTRGGGANTPPVNVSYRNDSGNRATTRESMQAYFREYLLMGAGAR